MGKQYYAILMRNTDLNIYELSDSELDHLTPKQFDFYSTRINFISTNYMEVYNEFQNLKQNYNEIIHLAEHDSGHTVNYDLEFCIVRISEMTDWELFK